MNTQDLDIVNILHELIVIHNLRVEGYENASTSTTDQDLKVLFIKLASEGREYNVQLLNELSHYGDETTIKRIEIPHSESFAKLWSEINEKLLSIKIALNTCQYAEEAVIQVYDDVLNSKISTPEDTQEFLTKQKNQLEHSYNLIKASQNGDTIAVAQ